jgi:hypothetical protein
MKNSINISLVIVATAMLGLIFYGLQIYKKSTCGQLYRYTETLPNGSITSYPMEKEYKDCLQEK